MPETWPDWIEELKQRYLADEASVFLLHGAVEGGTWDVDGEPLDCAGVLRAFLSQSRQILGTYDPDHGMDFASVTDRGAFNRLIETRQTLEGKRRRNLGRTPEEVLAQLYMALTTAGPSQGYIIKKTDQLVRAGRKHLPPLADGAPHIAAWATHRTIRASNNVVVLLAPSVASVRADLALVTAQVHVPAPPRRADELSSATGQADPYANLMRRGPPLDLAAAERAAKARMQGAADDASRLLVGGGPSEAALRAAAEAELEATLSGGGAPAPAAEPAGARAPEAPVEDAPAAEAELSDLSAAPTHDGPATAEDIEARLRVALRAAILRHPEGWTDKLPAREAVAATLQDVAPDRFGPLSFHVVEDESRTVGDGAADFDAWWRGDIAVDAAAGMALSSIEIPEGGLTEETLPELSAAAVRALARRIARLLVG